MTATGSAMAGSAVKAGGGGRGRLLAASGWTVVSLAVTQVLRLGSNLLLARLIAPEDFGTAAILTGLLAGLQMFSDVGLVPAVVRSTRGEDPEFLRTAFTLQLGRGLMLCLLMGAMAWPASQVYGDEFTRLVPVAGLVALLGGATSSGVLLATRKLDQRGLAILETVSFAAQLAWTLAWAAVWPGVWALVLGNLVGALVKALLSHWWYGGFSDRLRLEPAAVREIMSFGRWIFVSTAVTFLSMHSDRLLLGAVVPKAVLGVYSMATMMARLPVDLVTRLAGQVLFPALAEAGRGDLAGLLRAGSRARRVIVPVIAAASVGIACLGPALFLALYPPAYRDATWMLPLLVGAAWFPLLQAGVDRTLLVSGHTRLLAASNFARASVAIAGGLGLNHLLKAYDAPGSSSAGVAGFILGVGLSGLTGYALVLYGLTRMGARYLAADTVATVAVGAIIGGVWAGAEGWASAGWPGGTLAGWLVLGGVASAAVGVWASRVVRREFAAVRGGGPA